MRELVLRCAHVLRELHGGIGERKVVGHVPRNTRWHARRSLEVGDEEATTEQSWLVQIGRKMPNRDTVDQVRQPSAFARALLTAGACRRFAHGSHTTSRTVGHSRCRAVRPRSAFKTPPK